MTQHTEDGIGSLNDSFDIGEMSDVPLYHRKPLVPNGQFRRGSYQRDNLMAFLQRLLNEWDACPSSCPKDRSFHARALSVHGSLFLFFLFP